MREPVSIIIPTWNNEQQLSQCISSLVSTTHWYPLDIIIVNNGDAEIDISGVSNIKVLNTGKNLGWEGGLVEGLRHVTTKYVCFMNDDTYVPVSSGNWMKDIVRIMDSYPNIGAVGPSSNVVMGSQNIFSEPKNRMALVPFLIGYCMILRREALEKVGGVDVEAPGGDDIDLSIRLKQAGYDLIAAKSTFVYHHGFQTGNRIHGDHTKPQGWNSQKMQEKTNEWLIKKHGFLIWWETMVRPDLAILKETVFTRMGAAPDSEGEKIRALIKGDVVIELGVGGVKTVENAIGVDRIPKGENIPYLDVPSVADVVQDVEDPLPFEDNYADCLVARHILEHVVDTVDTMKSWTRVLKKGGQLIIAVPNEELTETIVLNPEHVHAFTPDSLKHIGEAIGLKCVHQESGDNTVSFITVFQKL